MITEIKMCGCVCDHCGKQWHDEMNGFVAYTDKASMKQVIGDDDSWAVIGDKHYCEKCRTLYED